MNNKIVYHLLSIFYLASCCMYASDPLSSSYDELLEIEQSGYIQLDFSYNVNNDYATTTTASGGSVSSSMNSASLSTSTSATSSAILESKARLRFHPGQGHVCTFGAFF